MTAADLVLIPTRPRAFDLHAIQTTAGLIRYAGKPAFAILLKARQFEVRSYSPRPAPLSKASA